MRLALIALILLAIPGQGIDIIQESSGMQYFAYAIEVGTDGNKTIWVDETTLEFLDEQPGVRFVEVH